MDFEGAPWPRMLVGNAVTDLIDLATVRAMVVDALVGPSPLAIVSANLDHIHHFAKDADGAALPSAQRMGERSGTEMRWLSLLDGVPLVRQANKLTGRHWPKLSGSDIIEPLLEMAVSRSATVGFLGGTEAAHRELQQRLPKRFPSLQNVGMWAPLRSEITDSVASERIAAEIKAAGVDILVVALGKPRQEEWIARFGAATGARVLLAFGAAIDFMAGERQRAPRFISDTGVEWMWRLALEPRRLARRYLVHGTSAWLRMKHSANVAWPAVESGHEGGEPGTFVGREGHAQVTAVVVTYNSARHIPMLIDSLRRQARQTSMRLVVVDNQSSDDTAELVRAHQDVIWVPSGANLGYAGGINVALRNLGSCDAVLILNPDIMFAPNALSCLRAVLDKPGTGAVVPLIVDQNGVPFPSLYREPSLTRAFGDAFLGGKVRSRPSFSSEFDLRHSSYTRAHDVDWAIGAALLIPTDVINEVGPWNESFFLFSEEVDYFRRIRATGRHIRFDPAAVVMHRLGISGSAEHLALRAVNRVRYVETYHGRAYASAYRLAVALSEALRSYEPAHRKTLRIVMKRRLWRELPKSTKPVPAETHSATLYREHEAE